MLGRSMFGLKRAAKTHRGLAAAVARSQSCWTQDNVLKSPCQPLEVPKMTMYDYVWQNLDRWPERTLTVCGETGRGYTFEQTFRMSNNLAANLRTKFGVRDGDAVGILLPNLPDYPIVMMAIFEAGGVATTFNPSYTAHEIYRQIQIAKPKAIFTLPEAAATVKAALAMAKVDMPIIVVKTTESGGIPEGTVLFSELANDAYVDKSCLREVRRTAEDVCVLPFSSGTTGLPKGVRLSSRNLIANLEQISDSYVQAHNDTTATHQDAVMSVLPFFHIYGLVVVMFHKMHRGMKLVTLSKLTPEKYFRALEKYRTNVVFAAPPLVQLMGAHPAATPELLDCIQILINGAAPMTPVDAERLLKKIPNLDIRQGYGLTETGPVISLGPKHSKNYHSVGVPLPNTEVKIVDDKDQTLGPNNKGELLVRGPQVMPGYLDNPKADSEVFTDGWFRTGDLAYINEAGTIFIADRLKELIKVKGFQVPPAELEKLLREHPGVSDAAVIGVPHEKHGETPKAFVVLNKNAKPDIEDIKGYVNERVAPYKRIDNIVFIDNIPKSLSGKVLRKNLKDM